MMVDVGPPRPGDDVSCGTARACADKKNGGHHVHLVWLLDNGTMQNPLSTFSGPKEVRVRKVSPLWVIRDLNIGRRVK